MTVDYYRFPDDDTTKMPNLDCDKPVITTYYGGEWCGTVVRYHCLLPKSTPIISEYGSHTTVGEVLQLEGRGKRGRWMDPDKTPRDQPAAIRNDPPLPRSMGGCCELHVVFVELP
jgi:hypothetical protein